MWLEGSQWITAWSEPGECRVCATESLSSRNEVQEKPEYTVLELSLSDLQRHKYRVLLPSCGNWMYHNLSLEEGRRCWLIAINKPTIVTHSVSRPECVQRHGQETLYAHFFFDLARPLRNEINPRL